MNKTLPTLEINGYRLRNGIELHNNAPSTFLIPSESQKAKVIVGNLVKLSFEIRTVSPQGGEKLNGERMWVIVVKREGDWFEGILDNQPYCTQEIKPGLVVTFKSEHIIDIFGEIFDLKSPKFDEYRNKIKELTQQ